MKSIKLEGDMVFANPCAKQALKELDAKENIELDFKDVETIDSTGIDILIHIFSKLTENGKFLKITNARKEIKDLLELCSLPVE